MRQPRPAARFAETPSTLRTFAPILGEHTDAVLAEVGFSADEIGELRTSKVVA
jgi:crotonobetainyl-CoA:carnitine CoA-transferase CaiB-like acyl-CoA transferase